MTNDSAARVGFLGAGHIAGPYAESLGRAPGLDLIGVLDVDREKAAHFAETFGCRAYENIDQLCSDRLDVVVNLTRATDHYATTQALLLRGASVYSEKPLALEAEQARELVALATERGARLACAPSLWLGRPTLAAADAVRSGLIGDVRLVCADVNQGRIETWHPSPQAFFQVGPVFDAGIYPLVYLAAVLGPIRSVVAESAMLLGARRTLSGEDFTPATADGWVVIARTASGCIVRMSCNFYVASATSPRALEFHGDSGSIRLDDWMRPGSAVHHAVYGGPYEVLVPADLDAELDWALGLVDFVESGAAGRPARAGAELAAHIVEVVEAINESAGQGRRMPVQSDFPSPFALHESVR